jgi:hypothetical protein
VCTHAAVLSTHAALSLSTTPTSRVPNRSVVHRRFEFVSSSGKLLTSFDLSECGQAARAAGGVNETRGVSRPRLLKALAQQLPAGSIRFNSSVVGLTDDSSGGLGLLRSCVVLAATGDLCRPDTYNSQQHRTQ